MAYDEALADRVRDVLADRAEVSERKMFGGIAFMVGGNMAVGVVGEDLMVRLGPEDTSRALTEPHVRPMDFTGKASKSMVFVSAEGVAGDEALGGWVDTAAAYALSLGPKPMK